MSSSYFWLDGSNNRYYVGQPFTAGGVQYTSAGATTAQFTTLGYTQITTRLNTFWLTSVLGRTHDVHFTSTTPKKLRLHLRDVTSATSALMSMREQSSPSSASTTSPGSTRPASGESALTSWTRTCARGKSAGTVLRKTS